MPEKQKIKKQVTFEKGSATKEEIIKCAEFFDLYCDGGSDTVVNLLIAGLFETYKTLIKNNAVKVLNTYQAKSYFGYKPHKFHMKNKNSYYYSQSKYLLVPIIHINHWILFIIIGLDSVFKVGYFTYIC